MEGAVFAGVALEPFLQLQNLSLADGCNQELMEAFLTGLCQSTLPKMSEDTCVDFIIKTFNISEAQNDMDRIVKFIEFSGKQNPNALVSGCNLSFLSPFIGF